MRYQPGWDSVKRVETGKGSRDCAGRYRAIAAELRGHRGFRVLDVGAYTGYFSLRLIDQFNASATAIDDFPALRNVRHARLRTVTRRVNLDELHALGSFDVALCLSVLHHVPWWPKMLEALLEQSRITFIEPTNPREELPRAAAHSPRIDAAVRATGGRVIARTTGYDQRYRRDLYAIGSLE